MKTVDLRSDTVTQPTREMRAAMSAAELGDDVYGEDPSVNRLEALAAEMLGTEAAIFACSGTQTNLLALMAHCQRGDEYIVGQHAHTYRYEAGGAAVLGSIQPQPIDFESDGSLDLDSVRRFIKPDDCHFARTRLLCLENTQAGKVLPLDYLEKASVFAKQHALALHLDGARVFNASVKLGVPVTEISKHFDSVSVCLSKGLGAPVGSVLCASRELIALARRHRKLLGGGMRQAGVLAAAGVFALRNHVQRLEQDHANAARLASGLAAVEGIDVLADSGQTNMVFVAVRPPYDQAVLRRYLHQHAVRISEGNPARLVTHLDVSEEDMERVIDAVAQFFATRKQIRPADVT